jgi:hypothetical protein
MGITNIDFDIREYERSRFYEIRICVRCADKKELQTLTRLSNKNRCLKIISKDESELVFYGYFYICSYEIHYCGIDVELNIVVTEKKRMTVYTEGVGKAVNEYALLVVDNKVKFAVYDINKNRIVPLWLY